MTNFSNNIKNLGSIGRIIGATIAVGSLVYETGRLSQKVDNLVPIVHAQEEENKNIRSTLYYIHGDICKNTQKLESIDEDIKIIKKSLTKKINN